MNKFIENILLNICILEFNVYLNSPKTYSAYPSPNSFTYLLYYLNNEYREF